MPLRLLTACWYALFLWITTVVGLDPAAAVGAQTAEALGAAVMWGGGVGFGSSIDLLGVLGLHNTTRLGVSLTQGPIQMRPAYYLQGEHRDLRVPQTVLEHAAKLLHQNSEWTMAASLRQEEANSGTIVSFSHGSDRFLELQSSGRKDEIRLHYKSYRDTLVHVETFPYRLADGAWHRVALSVSGSQVELLVDCHPLYRRLLRPGPPDRNVTTPQIQLWIAQRNNKHSFFKGALQDVRLITGPHGYLSQCPHLDSTCPTCGQFTQLQSTVQELARKLTEVSRRLEAAEIRIGKVEDCDCLKSCHVNGTVHADGASWHHDCEVCTCMHGVPECRPVQCPPVSCLFPVTNPGECCPSCLKQCYMRGVMYDHGEQVALRECFECKCHDGNMHCSKVDPQKTCPELKCPPSQQFSVPGECCKFCPDIDECQQQGDHNGHHCNSNTRCVNTHGSYICECLPGYRRVDKFNCDELDECSTGEHMCHSNATCKNTNGSYHCQCRVGYTGDGYHCEPICRQKCLNGGKCVGPDQCSCIQGFIGPNCELDLDECATGLHRCHETSMCVNMPGWSYCKCKPGYHSIIHDNTLSALCQDIDECKEKTHTCHPSAKCVNTEGSYKCDCIKSQPDCRLNCMFENKEIAHGTAVSPAGEPCRRCECNYGVISCKDPTCDCSKLGSERDHCCPQCDPDKKCTHQELQHVIFRSGERWIYQCMTCECLFGEIDCWPMECPPLTCSDPILNSGDCCPRCENDPCLMNPAGSPNSTDRGQPCSYMGHVYDSGMQWRDPNDRCTACNCKDGRLCCSFDIRCGEPGSSVGRDSQSTVNDSSRPTGPKQNVSGNRRTSAPYRSGIIAASVLPGLLDSRSSVISVSETALSAAENFTATSAGSISQRALYNDTNSSDIGASGSTTTTKAVNKTENGSG